MVRALCFSNGCEEHEIWQFDPSTVMMGAECVTVTVMMMVTNKILKFLNFDWGILNWAKYGSTLLHN